MRLADHAGRYLAVEWDLWNILGVPIPQAHPRVRKGGSAHSVCAQAPLLSSHWQRTKCQGPEQRNLYTAPLPTQAPESCFLFIPYCWDSMGRNSAPLPHCSDTNVHSPQGLLRGSIREGEIQGLLTKGRLCAGALGVCKAWMGRTGANLSHTGQSWDKGTGPDQACSQGPTVEQEGERACSCLLGVPLSQSLMGSRAF